MNVRKSVLVLLALGLAVLPAAAQTPKIQAELEARLALDRARLKADNRERYEEIEIMARLLDRGLARYARVSPLADRVSSIAFSPDGKVLATGTAEGNVRVWELRTGKQLDAHAGSELPGIQGVYLKGQGVVYTMSVPQHFQKVVGGADKPAGQPLTEWERVRKELRGEKVQADPAKQQTDLSIADAILHVLGDNGTNLTQLSDGESVTVAITLLPAQSCVKCHAGPGAGGRPGMMGNSGSGMMSPSGMPPGRGTGGTFGGIGTSSGTLSGTSSSGGGTFSGTSGSGGGAGSSDGDSGPDRAEFRKHALMGDLAMKQHDYVQAVEAYQKAIGVRRNLPHESAMELEVIEVASKWGRALLAQGKAAEAEKVLRGLVKLAEDLGGTQRADQPAEGKASMTLPGKLIITVPMKLLGQLSSGKMSFGEFHKAATVEHLTFDKPTEKPKGGVGTP